MTIAGQRISHDPRKALQQIINQYPKADREKLLRIFIAHVIDSRELERAVIAEMATSWFPEAFKEL
jgi:ribosomal 50S subunit-associated protein YjgA (DUF615 family)